MEAPLVLRLLILEGVALLAVMVDVATVREKQEVAETMAAVSEAETRVVQTVHGALSLCPAQMAAQQNLQLQTRLQLSLIGNRPKGLLP